MEKYSPIDLGKYAEFDTSLLRGKHLVVLPSQGEKNTKILTGIEGEMLYEHRQAGEAMGNYPGIFISRVALPKTEAHYRNKLFGDHNPHWMIPGNKIKGGSLDQIVLANPGFLSSLAEEVAKKSAGESSMSLYGFNQTEEMEAIAQKLGVPYYGNSKFANWAGTKVGLSEFAGECGIYTPMTVPIYHPGQLKDAVLNLAQAGYEKVVVKVSHSTGGMGHLISSIADIVRGHPSQYLPNEFTPEEGGVVQGWVPDTTSVSIATFIDFDGSYKFTSAQAHLLEGQSALGAIGAEPIDKKYLDPILAVGHKLAKGYSKHQAWGPHTMGMLIVPPHISEKLGFPVGAPLCNDENTRPGASTISKAWILALREGQYGIGWVVSKLKVAPGTKIEHVIEVLQDNKLLITKTGPNAEGIFVFNGSVLDSGYEDSFYAVAISGKDDPYEAAHLIKKAQGVFKNDQ
ncbi:hypothetical protein A2631_01050 [Candidatus Daviesbacteria bacterium RIFCSPHIGHO2_01_FULL_44_29]|uniref:Uncharacterized protein n=1 Tax=Candidatus Daviesbacteria bacterium RIFCSPHIGHO2_02_FULL_43_12 TaxID=1797776 RepID=A0A1F5KIF8_9BACT|nr:MAG: hypothetical protein A2631_01050 [Candidatus Daviesbacteria bacterium RIFCSPHIGHO2_01_FULL_44_29]OGE40427.1 MAG: hypothetical protein A3E86_03235 [Candidatus Daviesbacteria bacterium RIFCSPHIGHO2_12_FULL_47_45]OGE40737.1 MAG: hypothetical protein A3D25_05695 [Candidatus Daviesbacteria bacterium RIFCSPHIGHO2_02_FULL_43_12]OGE69766.1 MAG: hypothetical protein A3B55_05115 [Candidatus Daviesbacteria bacterium RIFCSPLOWO2_01_FULL_43_15]